MARAILTMTCLIGLIAIVIGVSLARRWMVTPGETMIGYSNQAVEQARLRLHVDLDYSEASIGTLDLILAKEESKQSRMWAAYFGEVIRRQHGGVWMSTDVLETKGAQVEAALKVRQRLAGGSANTLESYYEALLTAWSR